MWGGISPPPHPQQKVGIKTSTILPSDRRLENIKINTELKAGKIKRDMFVGKYYIKHPSGRKILNPETFCFLRSANACLEIRLAGNCYDHSTVFSEISAPPQLKQIRLHQSLSFDRRASFHAFQVSGLKFQQNENSELQRRSDWERQGRVIHHTSFPSMPKIM